MASNSWMYVSEKPFVGGCSVILALVRNLHIFE